MIKKQLVIISFFVFILNPLINHAYAYKMIPASWFENKISSSGVVAFGDGVRLAGGNYSGRIEGRVTLPAEKEWRLSFLVGTDGEVNLPAEFVNLYINGAFIGTVYNTPPGKHTPFTVEFAGDNLTYKFEFSSPSTTFTDHMFIVDGAWALTKSSPPVLIKNGPPYAQRLVHNRKVNQSFIPESS